MCGNAILIVLVMLLEGSSQHQWSSVYDRVMDGPEFSGFRTMVKGNRIVTLDLMYSGVTVFVPENQAIEKYDGFFTDDLVLYHIGTAPYTLKELSLNYTIESVHGESPPLWVTVVDDGYYINNAKIVEEKSNYVAKAKRNQGLKQVLHVIDRVLDPMLHTPFSNPSAYDFLQSHSNWKLGSRTVSNFFKRVQFHSREDLYKRSGGHTFFIPMDDKKHDHRLQDIDAYVIEGHVVPNVVLFTRPTQKNFVYETAANGDYIYIVVAMQKINGRNFMKSYTVLGNSEHRKGEILAEIVKANIPVTNGVVHLISQPLAVFDRQLKPFPYLSVSYKIEADPDLNITYQVSSRGRIGKILKRAKGMYTFFAPRDRAWSNYLGYGEDERGDVLSRHVIVSDARYTMSKLATSSAKSSGTILETLGGSLKLQVFYTNESFYLIWGQKRIKVLRADYECSDGVVHVVDDVFAAPRPPTAAASTSEASFWGRLKNISRDFFYKQ